MANHQPRVFGNGVAATLLFSVVIAGCGASAGIQTEETSSATTKVPPQIGESAQYIVEASAARGPSAAALAASADGLEKLPVLQFKDIEYIGAFRAPELPYTGNVCDTLTYAGRGLAFDPTGNSGAGSLFLTGHANCGARVAEISIPEAINAASIETLKRATLLQNRPSPLPDALEGQLASSGISGGATTTVNGLLIDGGLLVISAGNDYTHSQPVSHWKRPKDLSINGQVSRPVAVRGDKSFTDPRGTAGYMCNVPRGLQEALGAPALTGWVADSIVTATSDGPAAFAFDPAALGKSGSQTVQTLLFYPDGHSLEPSIAGKSNKTWNWTSTARGCAVPDGTRTVLFLGSHGTGPFLYGVGGPNGRTTDQPHQPIYDPADTSTGEHAWPYRYQVWAYDALDLARVRRGTLAPHAVKPYGVWQFSLPLERRDDRHHVGGVAYDPAARKLYFIQQSAGPFGEIAIHVFQITRNPDAAK